MNLIFKLTFQWGRSQAALFSHLWWVRSQRGQGAVVWSALCTSEGQDDPEPQAVEGPKAKRKTSPEARPLARRDWRLSTKKQNKNTTGFCAWGYLEKFFISVQDKIFKFQNIPMACRLWTSFCCCPLPRMFRLSGRWAVWAINQPFCISLYPT